jgi:hypothetical protein
MPFVTILRLTCHISPEQKRQEAGNSPKDQQAFGPRWPALHWCLHLNSPGSAATRKEEIIRTFG